MKSWYQITVDAESPLDSFYQIEGFLGCAENNGKITLYFEKTEEVLNRIGNIAHSIISEGDWEEKWIEYFKPLPFSGFTVVPPWLSDKGDLIINPAQGFGTGHHETTQCAAMLLMQALEIPGIKTLLDVGTGSGILAIAAKKKYPRLKIDAIDNDPESIENALENSALNGIGPEIHFSVTPVEDLASRYDVVVANIISSVLYALSDQLKKKTGRFLILSGVLVSEAEEFPEKMGLSGFVLRNRMEAGEWAAFLYERIL